MQFLSIGECMIELSGGTDGRWGMGFAGDTLNTLWYARAGLDPAAGPVGYFTALGTDGFSKRIVAFLDDNGIATDAIRRVSDRRPGLYMIEQIDGDRHFTYWRETSAARRLADDVEALALAIGAARLVYVSGITLAILAPDRRRHLMELLSRARGDGQIVAFDPNIRPALWEDAGVMRRTITEAAGLASIVLPSLDDETRAFGDETPQATIGRYRDAGAAMVVVKNGGGPVVLDDGTGPIEIAVRADVEVVDATGAGDSFNGAFLAGRLRGRDPVEAARAGCAMAAQVVARHGALIETDGMDGWKGRSASRHRAKDRGRGES